mmetsp:Transcript_144265/g.359631  ORF Transcript_144265/g.359631 Transcript_144265/m.359631 type:complete len:344 (+) Transcript_144265:1195-2226(+)
MIHCRRASMRFSAPETSAIKLACWSRFSSASASRSWSICLTASSAPFSLPCSSSAALPSKLSSSFNSAALFHISSTRFFPVPRSTSHWQVSRASWSLLCNLSTPPVLTATWLFKWSTKLQICWHDLRVASSMSLCGAVTCSSSSSTFNSCAEDIRCISLSIKTASGLRLRNHSFNSSTVCIRSSVCSFARRPSTRSLPWLSTPASPFLGFRALNVSSDALPSGLGRKSTSESEEDSYSRENSSSFSSSSSSSSCSSFSSSSRPAVAAALLLPPPPAGAAAIAAPFSSDCLYTDATRSSICSTVCFILPSTLSSCNLSHSSGRNATTPCWAPPALPRLARSSSS